jgi:hypothetical protein
VGVVADGTDEDGARAARMDEWETVWETERPLGARDKLFFLCVFTCFVRGARTSGFAHSALSRVEDFLCSSTLAEGRWLVPFVFPRPHIPWEWTASSHESNK